MPFADLVPTIEGRAFYCLDRLAPPDELVTAEESVPGVPRLWIVRDPRGGRFVCDRARLSDLPPSHLVRGLRGEVIGDPRDSSWSGGEGGARARPAR